MLKPNSPSAGVTLRSVVLALLLIPINTYFIMANHLRFWSTLPTTMSLIYNVVITLTVLIALNSLLRRMKQRWLADVALRREELLTIFVMLSISSAISGHDMMQTVVPAITDGFWFATPENEWKELFWRHLPPWLIYDDLTTLESLYKGESTLYNWKYVRQWLQPIFWWTIFLTILIWVMLCLDVFLRRQWIQQERLTYPIVQLPLAMTYADNRLFKSRMMWVGFAIAGGIDLFNGLAVFTSVLPEIPVRHAEISQYLTQEPWNAIGWTPVYIRSFAIGLAFLAPLDLTFSLWFFYWVWKAERIVGSIFGWAVLPQFPYNWEQLMGGYLALACVALWAGKRHFTAIFRHVVQLRSKHESSLAKEPISYRLATIGLGGGLLFLAVFSYKGGMVFWTVVLYFLLFYLLSVSLTRIRAEVGPPTIRTNSTPHRFLVDLIGSRWISRGSLTMMRLYQTFNRGSRAHPMPHTLEGFKIANDSGINPGRLLVAMVLATVMGILAAFWAYLDVGYRIGVVSDLGTGGYNTLRSWLYTPTETDVVAISFTGIGFLFTVSLWWLRMRSAFCPFHPAGYLISGEQSTMGRLWFSIFIAWSLKNILLKVGGIRLYRRVFPLFLGLILGEFIVGGAWVLIRLLYNIEVYSFYR